MAFAAHEDSTSRDWDRLEALVKRVSRRPSADELREFWRLYRKATSELARRQSTASAGPMSAEIARLNQLVASAHGALYRQTTGLGALPRFLRFFAHEWPAEVRRNASLVGLAALVFFVGAAVGVGYASIDPDFAAIVVPPNILASLETETMWTDSIREAKPIWGSLIFTNNFYVGLMAFALGLTAGLGTLWVLFANGVSIGGIAWASAHYGMGEPFWSFVVAHGALEIPAIFFAAAGGLAIARGLLFPGPLPRGRALAEGGRIGLRLLAGAGGLFLVAAAIEAGFSPEPFALPVKLAVAVALAFLLALWIARPDRESRNSGAPIA